jgi:SAM-dependent methyltransferase
MEFIEYKGKKYPKFQSEGNASQFAIPFAKHICKGKGVDIGFHKEDWKFPGAIGADLIDTTNSYHAMSLPNDLDYIYSSHCLEHLPDWVAALEFWALMLKKGGNIFLYLPHPDQEYWKPWNNRKHLHALYPESVKECLESFGIKDVVVSERDLNHSFSVIGGRG